MLPKKAQIGFILLDPVIDVCSKAYWSQSMIFTIAMKNVDLLKINPSSHCLENETATVYKNIGKISVN